MLQLFRPFYIKYNNSVFRRVLSTDKGLIIPPISRSDKITSSIKLYVSKCNEADKLIEKERKEFEFGRRYLAKMMGGDPETFSQNDIDESIRYLFPSGLFSKDARPIMTDPSNIYSKKLPLLCDQLGRPFDTFYYTGRPVFYRIMHEAVNIYENLKSMDDANNRGIKHDANPIELYSSRWMDEKELTEYCSDKISTEQYNQWLALMNAIYSHPCSSITESFLKSMRKSILPIKNEEKLPQTIVDPVTGRQTVESYGQKKWTLATVKMTIPGTGKFTINNESLLDSIPILGNRECILFPLQFTDTVGRVDVECTGQAKGESCMALAVRLAISRCLSILLPEEEVLRLRLAGLLTQDERYKEKKQPGKPKARKSPPWRPR